MADTDMPPPGHDAAKLVRNLKACDLCRCRKVKCHYPEGDSVCRGCRLLGANCTQNKPRRRRGPAKRSAPQHTPSDTTPSAAQTSPGSVRPESTAESTHHPQRSGSCPVVEEINSQTSSASRPGDSAFHGLGSRSLVLTVLTDWSRFVYPLALLHKKRFLQRILQHEEERNSTFCALVLSTCAVTVSTLRRRSFYNYRSVTVEKCIDIIDQEQMLWPVSYTLDWCITRYNMASALNALYGLDDVRVYHGIQDAMAGVQWLLFHEKETRSVHDQEMLKRLYWLIAMWQLAAELRGQPHLTFLPCPPFTRVLENMRPQSLCDTELGVSDTEVNAPLLWPTVATAWLRDNEEFVTGLNSLVDIMLVWERAKVDMTHKAPEDTLRDGMTRIQAVLDNLIPELRWRGGLARFPQPSRAHESQTVNILITSLYVRSNLLQHLGQAPGITHQSIVRSVSAFPMERHGPLVDLILFDVLTLFISSDVLKVLDHIPEEAHESNGFSLVKKVRDIGSAYLQELRVTFEGPLHVENESAERTVNALLTRLERLDFRPDRENA